MVYISQSYPLLHLRTQVQLVLQFHLNVTRQSLHLGQVKKPGSSQEFDPSQFLRSWTLFFGSLLFLRHRPNTSSTFTTLALPRRSRYEGPKSGRESKSDGLLDKFLWTDWLPTVGSQGSNDRDGAANQDMEKVGTLLLKGSHSISGSRSISSFLWYIYREKTLILIPEPMCNWFAVQLLECNQTINTLGSRLLNGTGSSRKFDPCKFFTFSNPFFLGSFVFL